MILPAESNAWHHLTKIRFDETCVCVLLRDGDQFRTSAGTWSVKYVNTQTESLKMSAAQTFATDDQLQATDKEGDDYDIAYVGSS